MKKRVLKLVAMLLMAAVPLLSHAAGGTISYTATYDFSGLSIGSRTLGGITYTTVECNGLQNWGQPGAPSLPIDCIRFSVPYNASNFIVTATPVPAQVQTLQNPLYPSQSIQSDTITLPKNSIYNSGNPYPAQLAWIVDEGMLAGENHIVSVAVMPISYVRNAELQSYGSIRTTETIYLTLSYELSETPKIQPRVRNSSALREDGYDLAQRVVVNPDDVRGNAPRSHQSNIIGLYPNDPIEDPETYLIVTTQPMRHSLRRLAALENQKGIRSKIVTVSEAVNDPHAGLGDIAVYGGDSTLTYTDDAGKLRQYLKYQFENRGTKYVLLAGSDVPNRDNSDMYFSGLDFDWMVYKDRNHELNVGRLLASSSKQINNNIDKLYIYELNPGQGDYSYLRRSLFTEGPGYGTDAGYLQLCTQSACPYNTSITHDDETEFTGNDLIDLINSNHYGFMSTFNDGWPSVINLYSDADGETKYYLWAIDTVKVAPNIVDNLEAGNGLNQIQNKYYPMIYCSASGQTMPFNDIQGYGVDINYGDSFTTGRNYGGPVYMGFTQIINKDVAVTLSNMFGYNLASSDYRLNEAHALAKSMYNLPDYCDTEPLKYNYLGDPALEMWSDTPQRYTNVSLTRNNYGISLTGLPTEETIIAYCSNDGTVGSYKTSSSSVTINDVSPNCTVMLYRHNRIPLIAPLLLQNITLSYSQYVIATDVSAGKAVDQGRTQGNVTVEDGVEYEIEATGNVLLSSGFKVERGATFAVRQSCYK